MSTKEPEYSDLQKKLGCSRFVITPANLFELGLDGSSFLVYCYLILVSGGFANSLRPSVQISHKGLEKGTGLSRSAVGLALKKLEERGLLIRYRDGKRAMIYELVRPDIVLLPFRPINLHSLK
jgi:DNA-binding transcriptional ArsR family regulator